MTKLTQARYFTLLSTSSVLAFTMFGGSAWAGCGATSAGNDVVICDAATLPDPTAAAVNLQAGNDSITVNSGTYTGGITGGAGTKTVTFSGGSIASYVNTTGASLITFPGGSTATITGVVTTGPGADRFEINGGTVNGLVQQGGGIDAFIMTGGSIGALAQGDGLDTFLMTGGTIVGAFEDGDNATMTGGTIGRVDMKLDNNVFNMSGGTIIGNLVTGFGNDTITVSNGTIGGNISVSGGTDSVTVTGGSIAGEIRMSTGADTFLWQGGGTIGGLIDMGTGDDNATLRNLTDASVTATQQILGGDGTDRLVLAGNGPSALNASLVTGFEFLTKIEPGTWTLSGSITGVQVATVQQGTLRLTGDNSAYAGQVIVDPAGVLEGRAQSITPTVANNGLVRFAQPDAGTYAGTIAGTGALEKTGAGTTILTGANNYTGGTTITQGTLQLGAGGTSGNIVGDVVNNGVLAFSRADTVAFAGTISGAGSLAQAGAGTTILTANNSYTGGTTIAQGTLQLGAGGTTGSIVGDVANNGVLAFNRADIVTFDGTISGTAAVSQIGTGTTILTASNSYAGGTTIAQGTLQLGAGGTTGGIVGDVVNNGALVFNRADTATFAGAVSGTGSLAQTGPGTTVMAANNSYTGGTTIAQGTLQLGAGGTSGSIVGDVANNGILAFNRADTVIFAGTVSGIGSLAQIGTGTTVLTGTNTYTGGTTITQGTLQLGAGGTSGSIVGNVANNGMLAFNRADIVTFSGTVSGAGALNQIGSGTTVLTANNAYTGGTAVMAGTLAVGNAANPLAALSGGGPVSVASGATLGGYGRVTGAVANSGTIAVADAVAAFAGGPKGSFTIAGTLTNAGLAQVGGTGIGNSLTVSNYVGQNGTVALNTFLGSDGSPSDRLVINGGAASGASRLSITNVGGPGAATTANGILVVDAINGAATNPSAFSLAGPAAAGAYEYILFHGGSTADSTQNWYLRNTVAPQPPAPPPTPGDPTPVAPPPPVAAPGSPPLPPAPPAGSAPIPLYRPEVPVYAAVPAMARRLGVATLGTFHPAPGGAGTPVGAGQFSRGLGTRLRRANGPALVGRSRSRIRRSHLGASDGPRPLCDRSSGRASRSGRSFLRLCARRRRRARLRRGPAAQSGRQARSRCHQPWRLLDAYRPVRLVSRRGPDALLVRWRRPFRPWCHGGYRRHGDHSLAGGRLPDRARREFDAGATSAADLAASVAGSDAGPVLRRVLRYWRQLHRPDRRTSAEQLSDGQHPGPALSEPQPLAQFRPDRQSRFRRGRPYPDEVRRHVSRNRWRRRGEDLGRRQPLCDRRLHHCARRRKGPRRARQSRPARDLVIASCRPAKSRPYERLQFRQR